MSCHETSHDHLGKTLCTFVLIVFHWQIFSEHSSRYIHTRWVYQYDGYTCFLCYTHCHVTEGCQWWDGLRVWCCVATITWRHILLALGKNKTSYETVENILQVFALNHKKHMNKNVLLFVVIQATRTHKYSHWGNEETQIPNT